MKLLINLPLCSGQTAFKAEDLFVEFGDRYYSILTRDSFPKVPIEEQESSDESSDEEETTDESSDKCDHCPGCSARKNAR